MEEKKFIIGQGLAQALLDYLSNKPYKETFVLIANLQAVQEFVPPVLPKKQPEVKEIEVKESEVKEIEVKESEVKEIEVKESEVNPLES